MCRQKGSPWSLKQCRSKDRRSVLAAIDLMQHQIAMKPEIAPLKMTYYVH